MSRWISLLALVAANAYANGTLTDDIRIHSDILGYDLQYRVYLPEGYRELDGLDVLYVTDGQSYVSQGKLPRILDKMIDGGEIRPVVTVFVDPRDPDNLHINRRNQQYLCSDDYFRFFVEELIPAVETAYPVSTDRAGRTIMGMSFGGTNAACFALRGHEVFSGIAMLSPANHPLPQLLPAFEKMPTLPVRMFLSTGRPDDNTRANREFRDLLQAKNYELKYVEISAGHNWDNWRRLLDDVLLYYYAGEPGDNTSD